LIFKLKIVYRYQLNTTISYCRLQNGGLQCWM